MKKLESLEIRDVSTKEIKAMESLRELLKGKVKEETFNLLEDELKGSGIRVLAVNNGVLHPVVAPREFGSMSTKIDHVIASTENFTNDELDMIMDMIERTNKVCNIYLSEEDLLEVEKSFERHQEGIRVHTAAALLSMKEIFHYDEDIEDFTADFNLMIARSLMDKPNGHFIHESEDGGKLVSSMNNLTQEERDEIEERKLEIEEELEERRLERERELEEDYYGDEDYEDYDDYDYDCDYDDEDDYYDDEDDYYGDDEYYDDEDDYYGDDEYYDDEDYFL